MLYRIVQEGTGRNKMLYRKVQERTGCSARRYRKVQKRTATAATAATVVTFPAQFQDFHETYIFISRKLYPN
jgi:hypothetical protein